MATISRDIYPVVWFYKSLIQKNVSVCSDSGIKSQWNVYKVILQSQNGQWKACWRRTLFIIFFSTTSFWEGKQNVYWYFRHINFVNEINARCVVDKLESLEVVFSPKNQFEKIPLGSLTWRFGSYIIQAANCKFNLFNLFSAQAVQQLLNNLRLQHIVPTEQRC